MPLLPEEALKRIKHYKTELDALKNLHNREGNENLSKLESKIKGFIKIEFEDSKLKLEKFEYNDYYYDESDREDYLGKIKHIYYFLIECEEEVELSKHSTPTKTIKPISNSKIDKIIKETEEKEAEAKRRGAVTETKIHGAAIEIITELRNQLKEKDTVTQELKQIKKDIADIKAMLEGREE